VEPNDRNQRPKQQSKAKRSLPQSLRKTDHETGTRSEVNVQSESPLYALRQELRALSNRELREFYKLGDVLVLYGIDEEVVNEHLRRGLRLGR